MLGGELTGDKTSKERTDFFPDQQQNQAHVIDSTRRSKRSRSLNTKFERLFS